MQLVINSIPTYANSCSAYYSPSSNSLQLVRDSGSGYVGSAVLGIAATLENRQCSINVGASTQDRVG